MNDIRVIKLANLLTAYSLQLKPGDRMLIIGNVQAEPLMCEVQRAALQAGAVVDLLPTFDFAEEQLYRYALPEQLDLGPSPLRLAAFRDYDALLTVSAPQNVKSLSGADPSHITRRRQADAPISRVFNQRLGSGELRWCGTLFPTQALAQEAGMGLLDYCDFVYGAGLLDTDDPIGEWRKIHDEQETLSRFLDSHDVFRIVAEDTDLQFRAGGRHWVNCDGRLNFPDGEVFTGPIEDSVEGHIRFSFPGIFEGNEIRDIRLTFEKGRVVKATAEKGEKLLLALLETDEGSRFVGEIAVGTNPSIQHFTRNMLFDEKIGGTVHLAIGRSIPQSLGKNLSAIHWDMLCDMRQGGTITADGRVIYRDGRFIL